MALRPPIVHNPAQVPALQILLLSEGYTSESEFRAHADGILQVFLQLPPFLQAKNRVAVWAHFIASVDTPVLNAERNTAFALYVSTDGKLTTQRPQRLVDVIRNIQVSIPNLNDPLVYVDGSEVWMNRFIQEESIVCVLARNAEASSAVVFDWPTDIIDPKPPTTEVENLLPCIFLSSWPLTNGTANQYVNPATAAGLVLSKQLGRVFGLADETELPGAPYQVYAETDPTDSTVIAEPAWPNVTARASLTDELGRLQLERVKWRALAGGQKFAGIAESPHPVASAGTSEEQVRQLYQNAAQLADSAMLLLRHPGLTDATLDVPNTERYLAGPSEALRLAGDVNLFEGSNGYRRGLYRPSSECRMRFEGYDRPSGASQVREAVDYCPVCFEHVRRRLAGLADFALDGVTIKVGGDQCSTRVDSRLADRLLALIQHTGTIKSFTDGSMKCVEATARRFEMTFNDILKWPLTCQVPASAWTPPQLSLPLLRARRPGDLDARRAWAIWNTKLCPTLKDPDDPDDPAHPCPTHGRQDPYALSNWDSTRWAGLGAPGAVVYLGFGCLFNRPIRSSMVMDDGSTLQYLDYAPLSVADFDNVQPGSILQAWDSHDSFREIVAYVELSRRRRKNRLPPTPPPDVGGHSLYFVGTENGAPLVADQFGVANPLASGWRSLYPYWIVAQWFDATGFVLL